jgi:hypothetical protein
VLRDLSVWTDQGRREMSYHAAFLLGP